MRSTLILFLSLSLCFSSFGQDEIENIGHGIQLGLPLTALGATIIKKDKKGTYQLLKSFALQTGTTIILKRSINRTRPNGGKYSFPSGHTSISFMGSTFLWKRYGWKWGVPATVLAGFVGYSRAGTEEPVHYWTDVYAGAAIGILSSLLFTKPYDSDVSLDVIGDTTFVGVRLKWDLR